MATSLPDELQRRPTADGFDTFYSVQYGQTFHSSHGALAEARHVFLEGAGVAQRLAAALPARILEIGFGAGLNFWLTAQAGRLAQTPLHYVALEKRLLPASLLAQLNHGRLLAEISELRQAFLAWREGLPDPLPSPLCWQFGPLLRLELILGDAAQVELPNYTYDAIYHDAFSPAANPELWTPAFFARLYPGLNPGGKLATYSAKGSVRRNLQAAGFQVQKRPGPSGKREMTVAYRQEEEE
jgi:tRNA U34 5-methylaminomethyl-2-thiouridine-forming methyltransferase MnmC